MHKKWIKPKNNLAIEIQDLSKTYINSKKIMPYQILI